MYKAVISCIVFPVKMLNDLDLHINNSSKAVKAVFERFCLTFHGLMLYL